MKFGIVIFPADFAIRPDDLAVAVEERGAADRLRHLFVPLDRGTVPGTGDFTYENFDSDKAVQFTRDSSA